MSNVSSGSENAPPSEEITRLLHAAAAGRPGAADQLLPLIYTQLRALAQHHMKAERRDHTLQATALVHEVYMKLIRNEQIDWKGEAHFYVAAADAMRRILIDHARQRGAIKRGGDWKNVTLRLADLADNRGLGELLAVNEALERLEACDPRAAEVVRLRFFAGLSVDETARTLNISPRSVDREWVYARAWLRKCLSEDTAAESAPKSRTND